MRSGFLVPVEDPRPAEIEPVYLGEKGVDFVKSRLKGYGALANAAFSVLHPKNTCFAVLEKGSSLEEALQFDSMQSSPTVAIRQWLGGYIASHWEAGAQLIIEDSWMTPEDYQRDSLSFSFFYGNSVPYFIPPGQDFYEMLTFADKQASSWKFSAFIISPSISLPLSGIELTEDFIRLISQNMKAVLVSAYDRESYIVVER